ncbi:Ankyrin repeat-containing protein [Glarea lozoyensis ATCC 20868]|uniref:Ankyrin repeat-containing protein n=1 Tax=Glarea lozoyensis (strain ATCC 20868 / MF5171) TaxID=1116229 RepID=S3D8A5_GLAL2|nr:Ankyrin repeat-containing protein [Glarea lozoyensis ATCC 20868]EPE33349.1 Ankyrin repeat-containing protein [Glarea lozoyensis ATCC 20868]
MNAVQIGDISLVKLLIENGAEIEEKNDLGQTSMHIAAADGKAELVELLLKEGGLIEEKNDMGRAPLHIAVLSGNLNMTKILLDAGAKVEAVDNKKSTPLHYAADFGKERIIRLLLDKMADRRIDIDTVDGQGKTALFRAASNGHKLAVAMLLETGAASSGTETSHPIDRRKGTALEGAVVNGHAGVVNLLLCTSYQYIKPVSRFPKNVLGADIKEGHQDTSTKTTAHDTHVDEGVYNTQVDDRVYNKWVLTNLLNIAMEAPKISPIIVQNLVAAGADINYGKRPGLSDPLTHLQEAANRGDDKAVDVLLAVGADTNTKQTAHYPEALQIAAESNRESIVKKLLAAGADPNAIVSDERWPRGHSGARSALQAAQNRGHQNIVGILTAAGALR